MQGGERAHRMYSWKTSRRSSLFRDVYSSSSSSLFTALRQGVSTCIAQRASFLAHCLYWLHWSGLLPLAATQVPV